MEREVTTSYISCIESDMLESPTHKAISKLLAAMNVTYGEVFDRESYDLYAVAITRHSRGTAEYTRLLTVRARSMEEAVGVGIVDEQFVHMFKSGGLT